MMCCACHSRMGHMHIFVRPTMQSSPLEGAPSHPLCTMVHPIAVPQLPQGSRPAATPPGASCGLGKLQPKGHGCSVGLTQNATGQRAASGGGGEQLGAAHRSWRQLAAVDLNSGCKTCAWLGAPGRAWGGAEQRHGQ